MYHHTLERTAFPRTAFSLVELLVVAAIFATLMGILLPVCSHVRESAKAFNCLSNLRQMAIAAQTYANQNDGLYPIAYWNVADGTSSICWDLTTIAMPNQANQVVPGLLWLNTDPIRIQQCPSFDGAANWLSDPFTGYNYNTSYIGHGQDESIVRPARLTSVAHPSNTALFGDGQWADGANKFMRAPFPNPGDATFSGRWAGTQGFRHLGRTNVVFCDGHAESLSDRFTANADGAGNVAPQTGFLSADNSLYGQ